MTPGSLSIGRTYLRALPGILGEGESSDSFAGRVLSGLRDVEKELGAADAREFTDRLSAEVLARRIALSSTMLANLGRFPERPLSACSLPPVALDAPRMELKAIVDAHHLAGMGTSFDFSGVEDPVALLLELNQVAVEGLRSGRLNRPVGNMGSIAVSHPRVRDFINAKVSNPGVDWAFNLSIDLDDGFMRSVAADAPYRIQDGSTLPAREVIREIGAAIHRTGDPGVLFMDRLRNSSPLRRLMPYQTVATCGEVGLAAGETCLFAYLNLAEFVREGAFDYASFRESTRVAIRLLDDALEYSLGRYPHPATTRAMATSRKVGLGVCGFASMLIRLGVPYASRDSRELLADMLSLLNLESKKASVELARQRGPCGGFHSSAFIEDEQFLFERFGRHPTRTVTAEDWRRLDADIKAHGIRNAITVALPPTGRAALVVGTTQQIEPLFNLYSPRDGLSPDLASHLASCEPEMRERIVNHVKEHGTLAGCPWVSPRTRELFKTAVEITPFEKIELVATAQRFVDDSVSNTLNLAADVEQTVIEDSILLAYEKGLTGLTLYRDGSRRGQPMALAERS